MNIEEEILTFIRERLVTGTRPAIDVETDLVGSGALDSTAMMELVVWVEDRYGIQVALEDLVPENFGSVRRLAGYLGAKVSTEPLAP
jgi:acyl carrier protein